MDATGEPVGAVDDEFVVHMDRDALNDLRLGKYDVTVHIVTCEADREIAWRIIASPSRRSATSTGTDSSRSRAGRG